MTSFTTEQVQRIAHLARLELSTEEAETYAHQFSDFFAHVEALKEVNTEKISPTSQVTGLQHMTREDRVTPSLISPELIACSPQGSEADGHVRVKSVF